MTMGMNMKTILTLCFLLKCAYSIPQSCKEILNQHEDAPSGIYQIYMGFSPVEVYCEMGLNGGGYTFFNPKSLALAVLTDENLQSIITDRNSVLMRIRKCDGTQPYTVLEQLPQYQSTPLKYSLSNWANYQQPVNVPVLGGQYLYTGFLPRSIAAAKTLQGIKANGASLTFTNCDANGNSHITLFPNFAEITPSNYGFGGYVYPFCTSIFKGAIPNPSGRVMPPEYFMFGEFHFGGCGCYTQSDARLNKDCILGFQIGFR